MYFYKVTLENETGYEEGRAGHVYKYTNEIFIAMVKEIQSKYSTATPSKIIDGLVKEYGFFKVEETAGAVFRKQ